MFRPPYWIYYLDDCDNLLDAEMLEASNEIDAVVRAQAKANGYIVEVWSHDHLIARLESQKPQAAAA